jgi:hypothetical protein
VLIFLRNAGVIDDQRPDPAMPLDDRQDMSTLRRENGARRSA